MIFKGWLEPLAADKQGDLIGIAGFEEYVGSKKWLLRRYRTRVSREMVTLCRHYSLEALECIEEDFRTNPPDPLNLPHLSRWRPYHMEEIDPPPVVPEATQSKKMTPLQGRLKASWFKKHLGLELPAIGKEFLKGLPPETRTRVKGIIRLLREGNRNQQRGHAFELRTIQELRPEGVQELVLEGPLTDSSSACKVDLSFPSLRARFELYCPTGDALPRPEMVTLEDGEREIRKKISAGVAYSNCGFVDAQAALLTAFITKKCREKGLAKLARLSTPLVLLVDAFYNDLGRNYTVLQRDEWARGFQNYWAKKKREHPKGLIVALKWYQVEERRSFLLPLPRTQKEINEFKRVIAAVFDEDKVSVVAPFPG